METFLRFDDSVDADKLKLLRRPAFRRVTAADDLAPLLPPLVSRFFCII